MKLQCIVLASDQAAELFTLNHGSLLKLQKQIGLLFATKAVRTEYKHHNIPFVEFTIEFNEPLSTSVRRDLANNISNFIYGWCSAKLSV